MSETHALSGAYAIDALDIQERMRFEGHLHDCPACQAEVASLREAAATLAGACPLAPPPPRLREAVLTGITTVRPLPPAVPVDDRLPRLSAVPSRRRRFPALLAAAAAVVSVAAGTAVTQPWADDPRPQQLTAVEQVMTAADVSSSEVTLPSGSLTLHHSRSEGRAVLVTDDLPAAPPGRVYEVWLQRDGRMVPAGLMPRATDQTFLLEGDASTATGAGITVEPAGGSTVPTTKPIALFDLDDA